MADDVRKNIFNPFFTTKDKGVGLGLFIVHNIIHAHEGYIEVESQEGLGTTFYINLPKYLYFKIQEQYLELVLLYHQPAILLTRLVEQVLQDVSVQIQLLERLL